MTQRQKQHIEAAKALAEFANAAAKFDLAWDSDGFRELDSHYPFYESFGEMRAKIAEWSNKTTEDSKKYSNWEIQPHVPLTIKCLLPKSNFEISSSSNDLGASLHDEESGIQIFCPNSEVTDEDAELYNTFSFTHNTNDISYNSDQTYETIEECIRAIKAYQSSLDLTEEKESVLQLINVSSAHLVESNKVDTRTMLKAIAAKCEHLITTDF